MVVFLFVVWDSRLLWSCFRVFVCVDFGVMMMVRGSECEVQVFEIRVDLFILF